MEKAMSILLMVFTVVLVVIALAVPGAFPVLILAIGNAIVIRKLMKKYKQNH